jgi:hypothetical protein
MKTPAREPAFHKIALSPRLSAVAVVTIIITAVPVVLPAFRADVLAVDPMMPARHVARDPNHLIVAGPIAGAMVVVWLVPNLDCDASRSNGGGKKNARRNNGDEQKFVFNHFTTDHARSALANTFLVAHNTF